MNRVSLAEAVVFLVITGLASTGAVAQSPLAPNASAAQIKRALQSTRSIGQRPAPRVSVPSHRSHSGGGAQRSGKRSGAPAPSAHLAPALMPLPPSEGNVEEGPASFRIQFGFGSPELRQEAIPLLDKLGEALLSNELQDWVFVVEGHTDASGDDQFNRRLSLQRAETVRDYLVSNHGIDASRLPVHGYGESMLHDPSRPTAAVNRRVSFSAPQAPADSVNTAGAGNRIIEAGPTPEPAAEPATLPAAAPASAPSADEAAPVATQKPRAS